jgi:hypothetical protein
VFLGDLLFILVEIPLKCGFGQCLWWFLGLKASVITLKPAIRYQFKTGQRDRPKT